MSDFDELMPWGEDSQLLAQRGHIESYRFWYDCWSGWRYEYSFFDEVEPTHVQHVWATKSEIPHPEYGECFYFWHTEQTDGAIDITVLPMDTDARIIQLYPPERPYFWEDE